MPVEPRVVYLQPNEFSEPPRPFRAGEAGTTWIGSDGQIEMESRVLLSTNSTHALIGHGVLGELNRLPIEGHLGRGLEVLLPPASLEPALAVFYAADRKTYGARYEFVAEQSEEPCIEYRIRIDNREYQRTLSRLQFLVSSASRDGRAVWIRI